MCSRSVTASHRDGTIYCLLLLVVYGFNSRNSNDCSESETERELQIISGN